MSKPKMSKEVSDYFTKIGSKGGKAGTGDKKRRPKDVCSKAGQKGAAVRWEKYRREKEEQERAKNLAEKTRKKLKKMK